MPYSLRGAAIGTVANNSQKRIEATSSREMVGFKAYGSLARTERLTTLPLQA
jgi:hypothetical protein